MNKLLIACLVVSVGACTDEMDDLGEVESASTPVTGQGTYYNGTYYNGTYYNGTYYNGTYYNGTYYNIASYGGTSLSDAATIWRRAGKVWEQRFPSRICYWNSRRTVLKSCTSVNLATTPSPLAGTSFPATFQKADGTVIQGSISIGTSTSQLGAVTADTSTAMHSLTGASSAAIVGYNQLDANGTRCDNINGCRVNSDIWLYAVKLHDPSSNTDLDFCPSGAAATALAGTWDRTGGHVASGSQFTFACLNGTIAKCTRWGYRPFSSARKFCDRPAYAGGCAADYTLYPMADYHQACVRAAAADYCANGTSFTKNGTLVDVHDYRPLKPEYGFVPQMRDGYWPYPVTGVLWESSFDKYGATQLDRVRYQELESSPTYPSVGAECPQVLEDAGSDDVLCPMGGAYECMARTGPNGHDQWMPEQVQVDSAPACAHSELVTGKWLHRRCSTCTSQVPAYCTDPTDSRGWDANCVASAKALCTTSWMMSSSHGECTVGSGLDRYDSGCTLAVCLDPAHASCCTSGRTTWSADCVAAADSKCKFAKNGGSPMFGFCMSQPTTTGGNSL